MQWVGSGAQREALQRVAETSRMCHEARTEALRAGEQSAEFWRRFEQAQWRLLRAETSCNFFWGADWVHRCHQDLEAALQTLRELRPKRIRAPGFRSFAQTRFATYVHARFNDFIVGHSAPFGSSTTKTFSELLKSTKGFRVIPLG